MSSIFENQILKIRFIVKDSLDKIVDLSGMTSLDIVLKKPDGAELIKPADLVTDGSDGQMQYTTDTTDLDVPGVWQAQGIIIDGAVEDNPTDIIKFTVSERL